MKTASQIRYDCLVIQNDRTAMKSDIRQPVQVIAPPKQSSEAPAKPQQSTEKTLKSIVKDCKQASQQYVDDLHAGTGE